MEIILKSKHSTNKEKKGLQEKSYTFSCHQQPRERENMRGSQSGKPQCRHVNLQSLRWHPYMPPTVQVCQDYGSLCLHVATKAGQSTQYAINTPLE